MRTFKQQLSNTSKFLLITIKSKLELIDVNLACISSTRAHLTLVNLSMSELYGT